MSRICWNTQRPVSPSFQPTVNCTDWERRFRQTETTISASASVRAAVGCSSVRSQNTAAERVMGSDGSLTISLPYLWLSFQWICRWLSPGT